MHDWKETTSEKLLRVVRMGEYKILKIKKFQSLAEAIVWFNAKEPISLRSWKTQKPKQ